MKRLLFMIIALSLSVCALFGSGRVQRTVDNGKPDVVAVNFPAYDFVRQIAGDRVNLTMLLPPGAESHSFEPTPRDIIRIQESDVFIYTGGESDVWVDQILDSFDSSKIRIIRMMDAVDLVIEEIVEGMEDDEHEHEHDEHEHEHAELNPADVEDRPLSDFSGNWKTSLPYLKDGSVDAYFEHAAEESGMTPADVKAMYINMMRTDYPTLTVASDSITINRVSAKATYKGFKLVESDHGVSPWYMYETGGTAGVPKYWVFNDHGHEAGRQEEEIAHIHALYGDESFDAIFTIEDWAAMYFDASATADDILVAMMHHEEEHEEEGEYDEHVWTSPQNAKRIVQVIANALCEVDSANAAVFRQSAAAYSAQLDELDKEFQAVVNNAKRKTIVFGDRFPFRYFADAYGLTYFAAFPGCSTETEPSAATVAFLIDKIKAEKIPVVFHIELGNERMAETIAEATGAKKLLLHASHNVSKQDFDRGATFLELQKANVPRLREALQ